MSDQIVARGPLYRASREEEPRMDAGLVRILAILGAGGLAILAGVALYGVIGHRTSGPPPVVEADKTPIRVKPENPGGMAVAAETAPITTGPARLAPPPEEPHPVARTLSARSAAPSSGAMAVTVVLTTVKSEAEAQATWAKLEKKASDVLSGHRPLYFKSNGPGPAAWQLRTGGFADPAQAKAFCERAKTKGVVCSVASS